VFGDVFLDVLEASVELIRDLYLVGARLWNDHHAQHRNAVEAKHRLLVLRCQFGESDVTEANQAVGVLTHYQVVELLRGGNAAHRAHRKLGAGTLYTSGGQLHVLPGQRLLYFNWRYAEGGEFVWVHAQAHGVALVAP